MRNAINWLVFHLFEINSVNIIRFCHYELPTQEQFRNTFLTCVGPDWLGVIIDKNGQVTSEDLKPEPEPEIKVE